jgi:hypothetical protein
MLTMDFSARMKTWGNLGVLRRFADFQTCAGLCGLDIQRPLAGSELKFDARAAKALQPGAHLTIDGCPGLRLEATQTRRAWIDRYRSPVDTRMRRVGLGRWPAMSFPAAAAERWKTMECPVLPTGAVHSAASGAVGPTTAAAVESTE